MNRSVALLVLVLLAVSCSAQEPEISTADQVPANQRPATDAAGDAPADGATVADLTFIAVDIAYEDPPTEAPEGLLGITVDNQGNLAHNVVIEGQLDDQPVAQADGGQTATGSIELSAGDFVFYCSIPGHREAGMEGAITIG